jgi:hypothetical protein
MSQAPNLGPRRQGLNGFNYDYLKLNVTSMHLMPRDYGLCDGGIDAKV